MKSLQEYRDIYKSIAENLGIQGDSVELLVQMLSQASYINEVENIMYAQEASIERCTLMNSKIQHCMNEMYSVFRGRCPRVLLRIRSTKYLTFDVFSEIVVSSTFKVYYLGYYDKREGATITNEPGTESVATDEGITYGGITIKPGEECIIMCLLARETVEKEWVLQDSNTFYVDCLEEDLSNDMWVNIRTGNESGEDNVVGVTRNFSDHIMNDSVFDLTLPSFGSRLYVANLDLPSSSRVEALYYVYSELEDYNESELRKINIRGAEMVSFYEGPDTSFIESRNTLTELDTGIIILSESPRDTIPTIHYRASRDRYLNSILRSNSDVGRLLEELYPSKVVSGGTSYVFNYDDVNFGLTVYYIPKTGLDGIKQLTSDEISEYKSKRLSYYVSKNLSVQPGTRYIANLVISVNVYRSFTPEEEKLLQNILSQYESKFGIDIDKHTGEIRTLISKLSPVKEVVDFSCQYQDSSERGIEYEDILQQDPSLRKTYFSINTSINQILTTTIA